MAEAEPDFRITIWRYTYTTGNGANTIFFHSPQESLENAGDDTLVLRQVNSEAENKVWVQTRASELFKRCSLGSAARLTDDAHGVILRDGEAQTIPSRPNEEASAHHYKRGNRVWVERSLSPTRDIGQDGSRIPVVELETLKVFEIPFQYICLVPQLSRLAAEGEYHGIAPGPIQNVFMNRHKHNSGIFFSWPAEEPSRVSYSWLNRRSNADRSTIHSLEEMDSARKRAAFRNQWEALTTKFAEMGLLFGDEVVPGAPERFESSDDESSGEDLSLHWPTRPRSDERYCNLSPCPAYNNPELDLVASYVGGYRWVQHHHVQDDDLDECPRGAEHQKHCVLRENRTRCAYATDRVRHTCCRLRSNPVLPEALGDPDDITLPLWETMAGDDHFVDVSANVHTRQQLEDRDEIPPQVQQLRQQMLVAAQGTSLESTPPEAGGFATDGFATNGVATNGLVTNGDGMTAFAHTYFETNLDSSQEHMMVCDTAPTCEQTLARAPPQDFA